MKKTLLEKAKKMENKEEEKKENKLYIPTGKERLELAIAWLKSELSLDQCARAVGKPNTQGKNYEK